MAEIALILQVDTAHLEKILLFERKKFLKEYTNSPYNRQNCKANLHTFCKAIYNAIFDFILSKI
jgi:myosin heavy subunit